LKYSLPEAQFIAMSSRNQMMLTILPTTVLAVHFVNAGSNTFMTEQHMLVDWYSLCHELVPYRSKLKKFAEPMVEQGYMSPYLYIPPVVVRALGVTDTLFLYSEDGNRYSFRAEVKNGLDMNVGQDDESLIASCILCADLRRMCAADIELQWPNDMLKAQIGYKHFEFKLLNCAKCIAFIYLVLHTIFFDDHLWREAYPDHPPFKAFEVLTHAMTNCTTILDIVRRTPFAVSPFNL
jgi:hypothetical protein